jgi:cobalt-zinc-cadmium efflux system membrane fusion protein
MRILLTAFLVTAGVVVGAAVPAVSDFVRGVLTSAGLPRSLFIAAALDPNTLATSAPKEAGDDEPDQ